MQDFIVCADVAVQIARTLPELVPAGGKSAP